MYCIRRFCSNLKLLSPLTCWISLTPGKTPLSTWAMWSRSDREQRKANFTWRVERVCRHIIFLNKKHREIQYYLLFLKSILSPSIVISNDIFQTTLVTRPKCLVFTTSNPKSPVQCNHTAENLYASFSVFDFVWLCCTCTLFCCCSTRNSLSADLELLEVLLLTLGFGLITMNGGWVFSLKCTIISELFRSCRVRVTSKSWTQTCWTKQTHWAWLQKTPENTWGEVKFKHI